MTCAEMPAARRTSRAFTLVELLIVLAIIAILASLVLGALYASQEKAKAEQTRRTIAKLDSIIRARWDTYRTRRVNIAPRDKNENFRTYARTQLLARWALQRGDLPDRYSDIFNPNPSTLADAYKEAIQYFRDLYNVQNDPDVSLNDYLELIDDENQSAECLYLIVTVGLNPGDLVQFSESEVGDTDGDGMPEFLDGYGQPINFLRWAAGFESELQPRNPETSPDPLDPLGVGRKLNGQSAIVTPTGGGGDDDYGFKLYPLIYSVGPDGEGAIMLLGMVSGDNPYNFYLYDGDGKDYQLGSPMPDGPNLEGGWFDNTFNHYLGGR